MHRYTKQGQLLSHQQTLINDSKENRLPRTIQSIYQIGPTHSSTIALWLRTQDAYKSIIEYNLLVILKLLALARIGKRIPW